MINLAGPVPSGAAEWGVDVSDYNALSPAEYRWIASHGASFAMIRAYDGGTGEDDRCDEHVQAFSALGVEPGLYMFLRPAKVTPLHLQLEGFVGMVRRHASSMPRMLIAIDIEDGRKRKPWTAEDKPLLCLRYMAWRLQKEFGTRPFLYYNLSFGKQWKLHTDGSLMRYPLWAARWPKRADRTDITLDQVTKEFGRRPAIWQVGGSGKSVPKPIPRELDKNVCPYVLERQR